MKKMLMLAATTAGLSGLSILGLQAGGAPGDPATPAAVRAGAAGAKPSATAPTSAPAVTGIAEARRLFSAKQYDAVDAALEKELSVKTPDAAAVRLSLDAATAGGRVVTASRRADQLLKLTAGKDTEVLFLAAETASAAGDARGALARYLAYARQVDAKDEKLTRAFEVVLRRGAYPEEYKKYVRLFGADDHAKRLGNAQLQRLIQNADGAAALDLTDFLLASFASDAPFVLHVHATVRNTADAFLFGRKSPERHLPALKVLVKHPTPDSSHFEHLFGNVTSKITPEEELTLLLELMKAWKGPIPPNLLSRIGPKLREVKADVDRLRLAKEYLAFQPAYAKPAAATATEVERNDSRTAAYLFLRAVGESPQAFAVKGNVLVAPDALAKLVDEYAARFSEDPAAASQLIAFGQQALAADAPARAAFYKRNLKVLSPAQLNELLALLPEAEQGAVIAQWMPGHSFSDQLDARSRTIGNAVARKDKEGIAALIRDVMTARAGRFNKDEVGGWFGTDLLTMPEKLTILNDFVDRAGHSPTMAALIAKLAENEAFKKDPAFAAIKAKLDAKPAGKDPALAAMSAFGTVKGDQAKPDPAVLAAAKAYVASFKGKVPADAGKSTDLTSEVPQQIFQWHAEHVWESAEGVAALAELWAPVVEIGGDNWENIARRLREFRSGRNADARIAAVQAKVLPLYVAKARAAAGVKPSGTVFENLRGAAIDPATKTTPFSSAYDLVGADFAIGYLLPTLAEEKNRQFQADEISKALVATGGRFNDHAAIRQLMVSGSLFVETKGIKWPLSSVQSTWAAYLASLAKGGSPDANAEGRVYAQVASVGTEQDRVAFLTDYLKAIQTRTPVQQVQSLNYLYRQPAFPAESAAQPSTFGMRRHLLLSVLKPAYEKLTPRDWDAIEIPVQVANDISPIAGAATPALKADAKPEEVAAAKLVAEYKPIGLAFASLDATMLDNGTNIESAPGPFFGTLGALTGDALEAKDWTRLAKFVRIYAEQIGRDGVGSDQFDQKVGPVVNGLTAAGAHEFVYAFVSTIEQSDRISTNALRQLSLAKAQAATKIPGTIPVGPTDPAYDLYVAAAALDGGDETRAWELTAPKLKLVIQSWEAFDVRYVAWTLEQMRKQKLLKEGLEFSFAILLREASIDPAVAARILLTKGEIYRDMQNYQAARIEFEGLRNNNRYAKTEAGGGATYRLIDLHIRTKDYSAAEALLERMVDADSVQRQADAYYLYAKMSFQRAEFKEAKGYLKKVQDRVAGHVEAALLDGELNLILPGGLANPEVAIGDPRLATVAIPGRPLTLELQDPNLSVARGGAAIPVTITTSKGRDVEHVKLLPSSSNKNLFTVKIATALGKVTPDDVTLQLRGDDVVSYVIDPEFQKANDIKYPPKILEVRSDARLVASSGEILTEDEEERRALELQLQRRQTVQTSRALDVIRSGRTVRPGSDIYVQVTDPDRDVSDEAETVLVDLRTSSGELLEAVSLKETGPHTGLFRGSVPTGIPLPKAFASDTEEGKRPAWMIDGGSDVWSSLADGRKGKWVEVDTMSSYEVGSVTLQVPNLSQVKDVVVSGLLADDYEELASFPAQANAAKGGLQGEFAAEQGGTSLEEIRRYLKLASSGTFERTTPDFSRDDTVGKGRDGFNVTSRVRGTFYLPANQTLELKYLQPAVAGRSQTAYVMIDGQLVLRSLTVERANVPGRIELTKGPHTLEILSVDERKNSEIKLGYRRADGEYEPLPATWFSVASNPELGEYLKPKGTITAQGDQLTLKFDAPRRLRRVRVTFRDFDGTAITVKRFALNDAKGTPIVPMTSASGVTTRPGAVAASATTLPANLLRIAPGDDITVNYNDERRLHDEGKTLAAALNSSYFNGSIALAEEQILEDPNNPFQRQTVFYEARRTQVGGQLIVAVTDYDEDLTDGRDVLKVQVATSSGEKLTLDALETDRNLSEDRQGHAGVFLAVLKIGKTTGKDTIKVVPGDQITVSYVDKENTKPGIPIERSYAIAEAGSDAPKVVVYQTTVQMVPDTGADAAARVKRVMGRTMKDVVLQKPLISARHPDYVAAGAAAPTTRPKAAPTTRPMTPASVSAPLLFEVAYPRQALHAGSVLEVTAVAESEIAAAAAQGRAPVALKVPTYIEAIESLALDKGYPVRFESADRRDMAGMLKAGTFAGVIRLQIGSQGDVINDLVMGDAEFAAREQRAGGQPADAHRVPTLLVAGSDVVHIRVKDAVSGAVSETLVRLLSDARLEIMDPTYQIPREALHVGEKFHVRLTDPDHDKTNDRDAVTVEVAAASGSKATLSLTETLPHSGVFTTSFQPRFAGEAGKALGAGAPTTGPAKPPAPTTAPMSQPAEPDLRVDFGDTITFRYLDDASVQSASPVTLTAIGRIMLGSDAQVVSFSKRFKDPEIAVKTRFLMAEALFEMAKEHRKLGQKAQAEEEIGRGERILAEAIRDYPNTSLAAQGEYLLANLAQELDKFQEAVGRYANVISSWPESEYAPQSQFRQALCFEKMGKNDQAVEEYVKLTYLYTDSPLVADSTVRLGNYYLKKESFKTAGKIFYNFQQKNPTHKLAPQALFLAAQCAYKQNEFADGSRLFAKVVEEYPEEKTLRAEAMYWQADSNVKTSDNVRAYRGFKRLTWDYPESQWAKAARGRLTEPAFNGMQDEQ